jgi:hypothetical protein
MQASQSVPLLLLVARGDSAGGPDVRSLPAQPAERGRPAVRIMLLGEPPGKSRDQRQRGNVSSCGSSCFNGYTTRFIEVVAERPTLQPHTAAANRIEDRAGCLGGSTVSRFSDLIWWRSVHHDRVCAKAGPTMARDAQGRGVLEGRAHTPQYAALTFLEVELGASNAARTTCVCDPADNVRHP